MYMVNKPNVPAMKKLPYLVFFSSCPFQVLGDEPTIHWHNRFKAGRTSHPAADCSLDGSLSQTWRTRLSNSSTVRKNNSNWSATPFIKLHTSVTYKNHTFHKFKESNITFSVHFAIYHVQGGISVIVRLTTKNFQAKKKKKKKNLRATY